MSDLCSALDRATNLVWYQDSPNDFHSAHWHYELQRAWRESPQDEWQTWTLTKPTTNRAANLGRQTRATLPDAVAAQIAAWDDERRAKAKADSSLTLPGVR